MQDFTRRYRLPLNAAGWVAAALLLLTVPAIAAAPQGPARSPASGRGGTAVANYSGSLPDGATWTAQVPAHWNGELLLYSHGYLPASAPGREPHIGREIPDRTVPPVIREPQR